jgi:hypothetical protein
MMKKILTLLTLSALLSILPDTRAAILIGSLSTVTTAQTNTATFQTNTAFIPLPTITVSNGALSATNSYAGYFRWSFDGTTFYTNASPVFYPASTNAGSVTVSSQTISVPIMVQMVAITNAANTGTITLGVTSP